MYSLTFPAMRNILLFSFLLVTLISVTESTDHCPSCLMPCRKTTRASQLKLFSSSVDSYTITATLDGYSGYFKFIISDNATEYRLYSNEISVVRWLFDSLCRILNNTPLITPVGNDTSKLAIQFRDFRLFNVYLQPSDDILFEMLIEKVATLQREAIAAHSDCKSRLTGLENRVPKLNSHPKLKYAISDAEISGNTWSCTLPYVLSQPSAAAYCGIRNGNWVNIDLKEIFLINYIRFRLYDQDSRTYTYSLAVSNSTTWTDLVIDKLGQSIQEYKLGEGIQIRYIRMRGRNTKNSSFHLHSFAVDYV